MIKNNISDLCLTVLFQDGSLFQHSYQLAYHPCPVWMIGPTDYKLTMPDRVDYEIGSFKKLLNYVSETQTASFEPGRTSIVVADHAWINYNTEFEKIIQDIKNNGFNVSIMLI